MVPREGSEACSPCPRESTGEGRLPLPVGGVGGAERRDLWVEGCGGAAQRSSPSLSPSLSVLCPVWELDCGSGNTLH